jgi:catechol 2,3-dioxygenase-like lactoylglutathione lyase family enzyme
MKSRVHISLMVSDLEAAVGFYSRLFGAEASKRRPRYANFRLDTPALHLALIEGGSDASPQRHYGMELFDKGHLETLKAAATEAGLSLRIEEQITCCYAVGDKFWAEDPDGNSWEFWVRTDDDADSLAPIQSAETESGCCTPEPSCCG